MIKNTKNLKERNRLVDLSLSQLNEIRNVTENEFMRLNYFNNKLTSDKSELDKTIANLKSIISQQKIFLGITVDQNSQTKTLNDDNYYSTELIIKLSGLLLGLVTAICAICGATISSFAYRIQKRKHEIELAGDLMDISEAKKLPKFDQAVRN